MTDRPSATRWWLTLYLLVRALAVTVLGILLLIRPDDTVRTLARVTGAVLLVVGAIDLVAALLRMAVSSLRPLLLLRGVVTVGIGAILLALTDVTVTVIAILIGMQLVVGGGVSMLVSVRLRGRVRAWRAVAVRGSITLAIGVVALVWPGRSVATLALLFGAQWILGGLVTTTVAVQSATGAD